MCNTGMRPSEAKNLRWRDVSIRKDREGRDVAELSVTGKGKARVLVAPASVAEYLDRIRAIAKAKAPDDRVFTTHTGEPAKTLYKNKIEDLLTEAQLRQGPSGIPRSTYSFRHTYATFRLSEGINVYFLAEQMGTSVAMIEDHYGHVSPTALPRAAAGDIVRNPRPRRRRASQQGAANARIGRFIANAPLCRRSRRDRQQRSAPRHEGTGDPPLHRAAGTATGAQHRPS